MLKLAASSHLDNEIYRRLVNVLPDLDIVKVQGDELEWIDKDGDKYPESEVRWATRKGRILVTPELDNINIEVFQSKIDKKEKVRGLILVAWWDNLDKIVEDLLLVIQSSSNEEWDGKLLYIPLS